MSDCIFCKIAQGEIPSTFVYEDDMVCAFSDLHPQAKHHILIIPKQHIASVDKEPTPELSYALFHAAHEIYAKSGEQDGYRLVTNVGKNAGQTVFHLHVHMLFGENLTSSFGA